MPQTSIVENRSGPRYVATLRVIAEVLRIERNPAHPQAALQLLGETDEWRGVVWEQAAIQASTADNDGDDYDDF